MSLSAPWVMDPDIQLPTMPTDRGTVMVFIGDAIEALEVPTEMVERWKRGEGGLFRAIAVPLDRQGNFLRALRLKP